MLSTLLNRLVAIGLWVALLGASLNWRVLMANGGMPVRGCNYRHGLHMPMDKSTKLPWLADWIEADNRAISPGDILICSGMVIGVVGIIWGFTHADDRRRIA